MSVAMLSVAVASSQYLGLVEMSRQVRFFVAYLFAANCLDSKGLFSVLAVVGLIVLATQAGVTAVRFRTGNLAPLTFGQSYRDLSQSRQYLAIDRSDEDSAVRGFGRLTSPGSTARLCMMVVPFALFLCVAAASARLRQFVVLLTAEGLLALLLTFTRVFHVTTAFQIALVSLIMVRERLPTPGSGDPDRPRWPCYRKPRDRLAVHGARGRSVAVSGLMVPLEECPVPVLPWLFAGITLNFPAIDVPARLGGAPARRRPTGRWADTLLSSRRAQAPCANQPPLERNCMKLSARNQLQGTVTSVVKGQTTGHVQIDIGGGRIVTASITNEAIDDLALAVGDAAIAVIKASDVMVAK